MNFLRRKQLFLLHFAGGSYYSFDFLKKEMGSDFEFIPLELPGRGKRFQEHLLKNKEEAIEDYFIQIKSLRNDMPYLIFGHSMGATLGLSIVNKLQAIGDYPQALIVSGNPGPGVPEVDKVKRYLLTDSEFKKVLKELGGVADEVLENDELYNFFSPIMRADFELLEKDNFSEEDIKLKIPLYALMGSEEQTHSKIANWSNFTSENFEYKILPGNHFFIYKNAQEIANIIRSVSINCIAQIIESKTLINNSRIC